MTFKIILTSLFFITVNFIISQTPAENLEKYKIYRDRIKYFYKLGDQPGDCLYSSISGMFPPNGQRLNFGGDQTIEMSWFIGAMATEYKLQDHNKLDTDKTLKDLYYALMAFKRLDECEDKEPWNKNEAKFDGFFMRCDMPSKTYIKENAQAFNKDLCPTDTFGSRKPGMPFWVENTRYSNSEMSQDQAIHMLMGLALVSKCLPDKELEFLDLNNNKTSFNFHAFAKMAFGNIISLIKNENSMNSNKSWVIYNPNGEKIELGGDAKFFAYGFAKAGQRITGRNYIQDIGKKASLRVLWEAAKIPTPNEWNTSMACILAAIGDSWSSTEGTDKAIYSTSKKYDWDTYYVLLWQFMNDKNSSYLDKEKLMAQINSAPKYGTYYYGEDFGQKPEGGWASNNRFRNTKKEQFGREHFKGNYNGLDFMLLYNLYQLTNNPIK